MGRHRTRASSDTSDDTSASEYDGLAGKHARHFDGSNTVSTRLRPRTSRRNIVYHDIDSDIDDFLESDEDEDANAKGSSEELPVALYNTIEKFLARRISQSSDMSSNDIESQEQLTPQLYQRSGMEDEPATGANVEQGIGDFTYEKASPTDDKTNLKSTVISSEQTPVGSDEAMGDTNQTQKDTEFLPPYFGEASSSVEEEHQRKHPQTIQQPSPSLAAVQSSVAPSISIPSTPTTLSSVSPIGHQAPLSSSTLATSVAAAKRRRLESATDRGSFKNVASILGKDGTTKYEYLVKYHNVSYLHCEWLSEEEVAEAMAYDRPLRTRFNNFCRRIESGVEIQDVELVDAIPERIVDCSDQFRALYPTKAAEIGRNEWIMYCLKIVDAIICFTRDHRVYGIPFLRAVDEDEDGAPGYYSVVKKPMDFGTVQTKLYLRKYESPQEFWLDAKLVFSNCLAYNSPRTDISTQCRVLEALFNKLYYEWAKVSRVAATIPDGEKTMMELTEEDQMPFVPLTAEELNVDKVIQHVSFKKQALNPNRQTLYLVKWKNRSYLEMSWELAEDIVDKMKIAQYHRHVRVPEYVVDSRGPAYWEVEMQRRMLQETLLHCKAAKEYLHGNMAVSVQALPTLSTTAAATLTATDNRWSFNRGPIRDQVAPRAKFPIPSIPIPGVLGGMPESDQQRASLLCRNGPSLPVGPHSTLMMGPCSSGLVPGRLTGVPLHMGGPPGTLPPGFVDQRRLTPYGQPDMFSNPLLAAALARFGRSPIPSGQLTQQTRLVTTTGGLGTRPGDTVPVGCITTSGGPPGTLSSQQLLQSSNPSDIIPHLQPLDASSPVQFMTGLQPFPPMMGYQAYMQQQPISPGIAPHLPQHLQMHMQQHSSVQMQASQHQRSGMSFQSQTSVPQRQCSGITSTLAEQATQQHLITSTPIVFSKNISSQSGDNEAPFFASTLNTQNPQDAASSSNPEKNPAAQASMASVSPPSTCNNSQSSTTPPSNTAAAQCELGCSGLSSFVAPFTIFSHNWSHQWIDEAILRLQLPLSIHERILKRLDISDQRY